MARNGAEPAGAVSLTPPRVLVLRAPLTFTNGMPMSPSDVAVLVHFASRDGTIVRVEPAA